MLVVAPTRELAMQSQVIRMFRISDRRILDWAGVLRTKIVFSHVILPMKSYVSHTHVKKQNKYTRSRTHEKIHMNEILPIFHNRTN